MTGNITIIIIISIQKHHRKLCLFKEHKHDDDASLLIQMITWMLCVYYIRIIINVSESCSPPPPPPSKYFYCTPRAMLMDRMYASLKNKCSRIFTIYIYFLYNEGEHAYNADFKVWLWRRPSSHPSQYTNIWHYNEMNATQQ